MLRAPRSRRTPPEAAARRPARALGPRSRTRPGRKDRPPPAPPPEPGPAPRRKRSAWARSRTPPRSSHSRPQVRAGAGLTRAPPLLELVEVDPSEQGRVARRQRLPGIAGREPGQRDHGARRQPVASDDLGNVDAAAAAVGDPAPQVVVLPAVEAAVLAVAAELRER